MVQNIHNEGKTYKSTVQLHFAFTSQPNVSEQQNKNKHTHTNPFQYIIIGKGKKKERKKESQIYTTFRNHFEIIYIY